MSREDNLKLLISRFQQKIFALILYLTGTDKDTTYEIADSGFVEAIRTIPPFEKENDFLIRICRIVLEKSKQMLKTTPYSKNDALDIPTEEKESLQIVSTALQALPFEIKALILLRDQINLSYQDIASVFRRSEKDVRMQIVQARIKLRKKIEELLNP